MERDTSRRRPMPPPNAYTLVELLVVVSIMVLLIAILLPSLSRAREDARRTVCLANLKHIGVALFAYADTNNQLGPQVMQPIGKYAPRSLLSVPGEMVNLGLLVPTEVADPRLFRCPSQRDFNYDVDPELFEKSRVVGSYAYAVHLPASDSPRFGRFRHLAMVSDDFTVKYGGFGLGRLAHKSAYNVLYTDASATRYSDSDESIWHRKIRWDDESDDYDYASFYNALDKGDSQPGNPYVSSDIFRVWHAFCYSQPDPFGAAQTSN